MGRRHQGSTALIAGVDPAEADLATILLEESELVVDRCAGAGDLIRRLEDNPFDVILVFADLARVGAGDLARVRGSWPWIRIVATADRPVARVGDRTLAKPWRPLDLLVAAEAARAAARVAMASDS